jgi:hypothetical protein
MIPRFFRGRLASVSLCLASLAPLPLTGAGGVATAGSSDCWTALDTGANSAVLALAVDGHGNLYAGGDFTTIGSQTVNHVAKWNGTAWSPLGTGMDASVRALAVDASGNLYAGGSFSIAGSVTAYRVAKWNGSAWSALGSGNMFGNLPIGTLVADGANLYAGGAFNQPNGAFTNGVARWDGSTWSAVGGGLNGITYALAVDAAHQLYAGGNFTVSGGNCVAKLTGASWNAVGSGTDGPVYALTLDAAGNVYVGGGFTLAGATSAVRVAKFDGANWSAFGAGMDNNVHELLVDRAGNLFASGEFTSPAAKIARWDGGNWVGLGSGLDDYALTMARDGGTIYAGGVFTTAGGVSALRIAAWPGMQYRDADGDGRGDPTISIQDCSPVSGYVFNDNDCDDTFASVYPGAPEVCDGLDNNCNGLIDETREATAAGLVAWWMADKSTADYADGHNGTIVGSVPYVSGQIGEAFSLDGTSGYVSIPHHADFDITSAITLEAWVKTTMGFNQYVITKNEDSFYLAIGPVGSTANKASFWLNGVTSSWLQSTTNVNDGDWHHLAATYDGAEIRIYVDGQLENSAPKTGSITTGTDPVLIGNRVSEGISTGSFDEIAVSNRALSAAEILAIFQNGRCVPLVDVRDRPVRGFELAAPWPNPTARGVSLELDLPSAAWVHAEVVDIAGRRVSPVLQDGELPAGSHRLQWNGLDRSGRRVAPGVYLVRVRAGDAVKVRQIIAIR